MVLSKRERMIVIVVAAAVALLLLNYLVFNPYLDARKQVANDLDAAIQAQDAANTLFARQVKLKKVWAKMQTTGLQVNDSRTESLTLAAINEWVANSRVTLSAIKRERSIEEGKFEVIGFDVSATGSMPEVARLLWALETSTIPIRVNEMQITPQKEGIDNLSVRLSVSALCMPPKDNKLASASSLGGGAQ